MKRVYLFFVFLLSLMGCSQNKEAASSYYHSQGKVKILSTTAMIDDLVGEIGGDYIDHIPLIIGEIDPHSYELVKGDNEKMMVSQVIIANGLNLEHGASLRHQLEKHPHVVFLGEEIRKKVPEKILQVDGVVDPHVWMDISLWAEGIDAIVRALAKEDPVHQEIYEENGRKLYQKMLATHQEVQSMLSEVPETKRYLVTSHDAFNYFALAYLAEGTKGEERCVAPEGLAPEGQLSSFDIQRVINHLSTFQIEVVFPESNVSRDALKKIISSCTHPVRICKQPLYGDAMGDLNTEAGSYLGMIKHNAKVLKEEWEK